MLAVSGMSSEVTCPLKEPFAQTFERWVVFLYDYVLTLNMALDDDGVQNLHSNSKLQVPL